MGTTLKQHLSEVGAAGPNGHINYLSDSAMREKFGRANTNFESALNFGRDMRRQAELWI